MRLPNLSKSLSATSINKFNIHNPKYAARNILISLEKIITIIKYIDIHEIVNLNEYMGDCEFIRMVLLYIH